MAIGNRSARSALASIARVVAVAGIALAAVIAGVIAEERAEAVPPVSVIDEAMFGYGGDANIQYVEIIMLGGGQNTTSNSVLGSFNADGSHFGDILVVPSNVLLAGDNVRWIMGTAAFAAASGITPNFTFTPVSLPATGMLCWGAPGVVPPAPDSWDHAVPANYADCVPYGSYVAANILNPPSETLGLGNGAFLSLTRGTHTDNTLNDFGLACPTPQNNFGSIGFNHDNHFDLPPAKSFDDLTAVDGDLIGDECGDTDDDNDGRSDTDETAGAACGLLGVLTTNPLVADTDSDRFLDQAECDLGSNPNVTGSVPMSIVAPDADSDGVPDAFDPDDGDNDSDNDGLLDRLEFRNYGSDLSTNNTDGVGCTDARAAASINADATVNVIDLQQVAATSGTFMSPNYIVDFDYTKDGNINVIDLQQVAARSGACP